MLFRHSDTRFPFLWETSAQPAARWHAQNEGPVQYLTDTPDGAWAEFLRHEEIDDVEDLLGIERDLWTINLQPEEWPSVAPELPLHVLQGGLESYGTCQAEARRLRDTTQEGLIAPSAALLPGAAAGWRVEHGTLHQGAPRDGNVVVLFGPRPNLVGWLASSRGRPSSRVLPKVRHFSVRS